MDPADSAKALETRLGSGRPFLFAAGPDGSGILESRLAAALDWSAFAIIAVWTAVTGTP